MRSEHARRMLADLSHRQRVAALVLGLAITLPFLLAAAQAADDGWYPVGDEAVMLVTTDMILSAHTPLSGEPTSSGKYGIDSQHPGPLPYYLLAAPVEVLGGTTGMLVGTALISSASLLLIGYVALRTAGTGAALAAWTTALLMVWSCGGTAYFYRPFKAVAAVLPLLLFLHLCVALLSGRHSLLPLWLLAGSYPVAASVQYITLVAGPALLTAVVLAVRFARRRAGPATGDAPRGLRALVSDPRARRTLVRSALVVVGAWWAPAYDLVVNDGGNARQLYRAARAATDTTRGTGFAIDNLARAVVFDPAQTAAEQAGSTAALYAATTAILLASTALIVTFRQRLHREHRAHLAVGAASAAALLVSLAQTPGDEGFGFYRVLGALPVGAFLVHSLWICATVIIVGARGDVRRRSTAAVLSGAVALLAVAITAPGPLDPRREDVPWGYEATDALQEQTLPTLVDGHGRWSFHFVGPRNVLVVMSGVAGAAERAGIATNLRRPPGMGTNRGLADLPTAGDVLTTASFLDPPDDSWSLVGTYQPADRDVRRAVEAAEQLTEFARSSDPVPLDALSAALPGVLCPQAGIDGLECPAANEFVETGTPLAELPPEILAIIYLANFDPDYPLPLFIGPAPPEDLMAELHAGWSHIPLAVYVRSADRR